MEPLVKRDFRTVTKTGNELIKTITTTIESPDHPEIIKEGLEAAIREYVSIVVEKAELNLKISEEDKYKFLGKLDVKSIFEESATGRDPVAEKSGHLLETCMKDQKVILQKLEVIGKVEKVRKIPWENLIFYKNMILCHLKHFFSWSRNSSGRRQKNRLKN